MKQKLWDFIKREAVLVIAALCALISMLWVPPSEAYWDYLDMQVLCLLFCLMAVIAGLQKYGLFEWLSHRLLAGTQTMRSLSLLLVLLPFFCSMFITNDVALITFVPFTIMLLQMVSQTRYLIYLIVLQTVAANLGSMLTPFGNPQNLFLFSTSQMPLSEFMLLLLPFAAVSLCGLLLASLIIKPMPITFHLPEQAVAPHPRMLILLESLFIICLLAVVRIIPYLIVTGIVLIVLLIFSRDSLRKVDYSLLATFICFFIFSGNMSNIPLIHDFIAGLIGNDVTGITIILSQVISNVPAAVFLAGFSNDYAGLIIGSNLGGLGTIVGSLASLISFRFYLQTDGARPGKYLGIFTLVNLVALAILLAVLWLTRL